MVRVKLFHFVWFFEHFDKLIRRPPGPLCPPPYLIPVAPQAPKERMARVTNSTTSWGKLCSVNPTEPK